MFLALYGWRNITAPGNFTKTYRILGYLIHFAIAVIFALATFGMWLDEAWNMLAYGIVSMLCWPVLGFFIGHYAAVLHRSIYSIQTESEYD